MPENPAAKARKGDLRGLNLLQSPEQKQLEPPKNPLKLVAHVEADIMKITQQCFYKTGINQSLVLPVFFVLFKLIDLGIKLKYQIFISGP